MEYVSDEYNEQLINLADKLLWPGRFAVAKEVQVSEIRTENLGTLYE